MVIDQPPIEAYANIQSPKPTSGHQIARIFSDKYNTRKDLHLKADQILSLQLKHFLII